MKASMLLTETEILAALSNFHASPKAPLSGSPPAPLTESPPAPSCLAFYSSVLGGVTTDPRFMSVPVDDHLVHRGDGVFEAFRLCNNQLYLLEEHLSRLHGSMAKIGLTLPLTIQELTKIIQQTVMAAKVTEAMVRLYVSRGPGNFGVNPYDTVGAQLYVAVTTYSPYPETKYLEGVRVGWSRIVQKPKWAATIKSCNYLQNVLMKKEAVDAGLDFVVALDELGNVTESATENIFILSADKQFKVPPLDCILRGTTLIRVQELMASEVCWNYVTLSQADVLSAEEVFMVGTTLDVVPVVSVNGQPIGTGKPGKMAALLRAKLVEDQRYRRVNK